MKSIRAFLLSYCLAGAVFLSAPSIFAQEDEETVELGSQLEVQPPDSWTFEIAPYLWFAGLSGDTEIGPLEGDVDADFSDIFDVLELGLMVHAEAYKGSWGAFTDLFYIQLEEDADTGGISIDLELDQVLWEFGGFHRWYRGKATIDALFGGRLVYLDVELDPSLAGSVSRDRTFVDPLIGARLGYRFSEKWSASLRADLAGFGVGSDLTFNAIALGAYDISKRFTWVFGYRYMNLDYDKGSLELDLSYHGPITGLVIRF